MPYNLLNLRKIVESALMLAKELDLIAAGKHIFRKKKTLPYLRDYPKRFILKSVI
jgi:hypothetical protein